MHINSFNNTSFTGQYVASGKVKTDSFLCPNKEVSIVELDAKDKYDFKLLKKIKNEWRGANFSSIILRDADCIKNDILDSERYKLYVVTKQKDNFEKMRVDDVLAQAEISHEDNDKIVWIEYLQVRPDCMFGEDNRPYTKVGKSFTDFCKEQFKGKQIVLSPLAAVIDFYDKQGFGVYSSGEGLMSYQA